VIRTYKFFLDEVIMSDEHAKVIIYDLDYNVLENYDVKGKVFVNYKANLKEDTLVIVVSYGLEKLAHSSTKVLLPCDGDHRFHLSGLKELNFGLNPPKGKKLGGFINTIRNWAVSLSN
jgi:hypothetical protein